MYHHSQSIKKSNQVSRSKFKIYELEIGVTHLQTFSHGLYCVFQQESDFHDQLIERSDWQDTLDINEILQQRARLLELMREATLYAFDYLAKQLWMTDLSPVKCLTKIQSTMWADVIAPAMRDHIYGSSGVNLHWTHLKLQLHVDEMLPIRCHQQRELDLKVFRQYVLAWAAKQLGEDSELLEAIEAICQSDRAWCVFPGSLCFEANGMPQKAAKAVLRRLQRKQLVIPVNKIGNVHYYCLNLNEIRCSRSKAGVHPRAPRFVEFKNRWHKSRARLNRGLHSNYAVKNLEEKSKQVELLEDWTTHCALKRMDQSIFGPDQIIGLRNYLLSHTKDLLISYPFQIDKQSLSKERQSLLCLAQPMLERRMLLQVLIPLVAGLRDAKFHPDYQSYLSQMLTSACRQFHRSLRRKLEEFPKDEIEYALTAADIYLPNTYDVGNRFKVQRNIKLVYGDLPPLSQWFAEKTIMDFAMQRGVRSAMERQATLLGYASWHKTHTQKFPSDAVRRELVNAYLDRHELQSTAALIARFSNRRAAEG